VVEARGILERLTLAQLVDKLNDVARCRRILIEYSAALDHQNHNIAQAIRAKGDVLQANADKSEQYQNLAREAHRVLRVKRTIIDELSRRDEEEVWLSQVYCLFYRNLKD